jgi:Domain of unknown function (DUF6457)
VDEWLTEQADELAAASGAERGTLELDAADEQILLDLARIAAHTSGERTNAPLLCYLVGLARGSGTSLAELAEAVRRSTS